LKGGLTNMIPPKTRYAVNRRSKGCCEDCNIRSSQLELHHLQYEIEIQPGHWRGYMSMGAFLFHGGRFGEAIPYYRRITELMPDNAQAFNDLGAAHFLYGDFDKAGEALQRSLALEPTALGYSNAGSALFYAQQYDQASDMFIKAVEHAPEDFHGWGSLGDAYKYIDGKEGLAEDMYRTAIKLANKRLEVNPTDAETVGLLAHYHANLGDRPAALRYLTRAAELAAGDMYTYYNAATAFCALGDIDKAAAALAKAVKLGYLKRMIAVDANLCSLVERPEFQPGA
jgi:tetratricopeptide (TPR) repeat protein